MAKVEKKLDVFQFGEKLIETNDLDPTYVAIYNSGLSGQKLKKFLLAYFCFYHFGTASWITDSSDYWKAMKIAAGSKEYPRSSERRHYRGQQAILSVNWLMERGVDTLFEPIIGKSLKAESVIQYVKTWRGFGDWISFKIADILERLGLAEIEFNPDNVELYESPKHGAALAWNNHGNSLEAVPEDLVSWAYSILKSEIGGLLAPPRNERTINIQEIETILCKSVGYFEGRYTIGHDIKEVRSALLRFAKCSTSQKLLAALPKLVSIK